MRALYVLLPAVLIVAAFVLSWEGFQPPQSEAVAALVEPPRYSVTGAEWVRLGRQGEPEFRARAATIDYFADDSAKLKVITLDTLGGAQSPWHVEAPQGSAPPHEHRLLLEGGVQAAGQPDRGAAQVSFETPKLWVDMLRRELYTDAQVTLRTEERAATARGLRADFSGERVQLLNDVQVDYVPES